MVHLHRCLLRPLPMLVALLPLIALRARAAPPETMTVFAQRIERLELEVDVLITDAEGEVVTALGAEKIAVLHDGNGVAVAGVAPPDGRPQRVAFYIDQRRLLPNRRARALAAMRMLANRRLDRGDRVLIASFGERLFFHTGFTNARKSVSAAFDAAAQVPRRVGMLELERQRLSRRRSRLLDVELVDFVARYREDLRLSLDALGELTAVVAADVLPRDVTLDLGTPGARASSGFFLLPPADGNDDLLDTVSPRVEYLAAVPRLPSDSKNPSIPLELLATANAARITFFPLTSGARTDLDPDPRSGALLRHAERTALLATLASWTGGTTLTLDRAGKAAAILDRELDLRHRVAFPAPSRATEHVGLEIRTQPRDLTTRARRTLAYRSPTRALAEQTLAGLRLGLARNLHDVRLGKPSSRPGPNGLIDLELTITVPRSPTGETVALCVVVGDPVGARSAPMVVEVPVPSAGAAIEHRLRVRVRPEPQLLVLGLGGESELDASLLHLSLGKWAEKR